MTRYEARPLPDHTAWGVFDQLTQTFVPWLEGPFETMSRRAARYNEAYQKVVDDRQIYPR